MTRFYDVEVLSLERSRPFAPSYFAQAHTDLSRAVDGFVNACKSKGDKVKKSERVEWLQGRAKDVDPTLLLETGAATFAALTRSIKGKKKIIASIAEQLKDPSAPHAELYNSLDDADDLIRPKLFLSYNMCSFLRPEEFSPIPEPEVVLRVQGLSLPEGAIPPTNFEFLRGWIIRHLRDHDQKPNPWLEAHTLEQLQGHHPEGLRHVFLCALEERTKNQAFVRFIARHSWVSHLEPGDTFQSAA